MRRHTPVDIDAAVIRLARQVDQLQHDVTELVGLRADVAAHSRSLTDLADLLRRVRTETGTSTGTGSSGVSRSAEGEDEQPPPEWLTITDPELAVHLLAALDQWIRDVWRHYHPLTACWAWHPHVVAELLTCQQLWAEALTPGAGAGGLGAWHDRWRPGTATRITRALTACERTDGAHVTGPNTRWSVDPAVLDELALWWATTHGVTSPPPGLTREDHR
jgi:hypothetical protein